MVGKFVWFQENVAAKELMAKEPESPVLGSQGWMGGFKRQPPNILRLPVRN